MKVKAIVMKDFGWYVKGNIIEVAPKDMWLVRLGILEEVESKCKQCIPHGLGISIRKQETGK